MAAFFIPGISDDDGGRIRERAYVEMRRLVELDMGRRPRPSRIAKLWTRRGSLDCETEVGQPDPLRGGTVMAIFDMGPHQPYVVWRGPDTGAGARGGAGTEIGDGALSANGTEIGDGLREVLGCSAYSVLEFDA